VRVRCLGVGCGGRRRVVSMGGLGLRALGLDVAVQGHLGNNFINQIRFTSMHTHLKHRRDCGNNFIPIHSIHPFAAY
jgi:hypothetical protein